MQLSTRHVLDRAFSSLGIVAIALMGAALVLLLGPIVIRGSGALVFRGTVEHRRLMLELFQRGDAEELDEELALARKAREPLYEKIAECEADLKSLGFARRREVRGALHELKEVMRELLGPAPGTPKPVMPRDQYGQTRWERAELKLKDVLFIEKWDYSDPTQMGKKTLAPRIEDFKGTPLETNGFFTYAETHLDEMLRPNWTFYWQFLTDRSYDAHFFGGIWPEMLGTFYLTFGAMLFALPLGVIAAVYLTEYAGAGPIISGLRVCISTLAGVPSIVFGLFGLAFFINTLGVSSSKSVLAGSLTLGLLVLPTVIRASEEAIRAVPKTYREAALSLGAGKWHTVMTVVLPAALPGILTGLVISMGRAAGETAPIIFTAAVSVGQPLKLGQVFSQPTPALPWNIYNLCTEHEAVDEIRHVQYGMVFVLVGLVLLLNTAAIILRARISKKLHG